MNATWARNCDSDSYCGRSALYANRITAEIEVPSVDGETVATLSMPRTAARNLPVIGDLVGNFEDCL